MALIVESARVVDPCHYSGDPFWDGDQTQYELEILDRGERGTVLVVVPRGNEFIARQTVARYVERLGLSLSELTAKARRPAPDRRPQVSLLIEPGWS
jgi:hypothetical protein